ncbi:MAG: hypothetical protein ACOVO7_10055, partial [Microcystis aeruginosa]
ALWYFIHDYNAQQSKGLSTYHYYRITTRRFPKLGVYGLTKLTQFLPYFYETTLLARLLQAV